MENEDLKKFAKKLINLMDEEYETHPKNMCDAFFSFGISMVYQRLTEDKRKDYCIKAFSKFLKYFEKNYEDEIFDIKWGNSKFCVKDLSEEKD